MKIIYFLLITPNDQIDAHTQMGKMLFTIDTAIQHMGERFTKE